MSRPESNDEWTCNVSTRQFQVAKRYKLETPMKVATKNSCRDIHLCNWDKSIDKKSHPSCRNTSLGRDAT